MKNEECSFLEFEDSLTKKDSILTIIGRGFLYIFAVILVMMCYIPKNKSDSITPSTPTCEIDGLRHHHEYTMDED